jgi:hypothetical protein
MIQGMGPLDRFARFRCLVLADPVLEERLRSLPDWPSFVEAALQAAAEHDLSLDAGDLHAAGGEARRAWRERWV